MKPKIITICGSSKFVDIMAVVGWFLEKREGAIVHNLHLLPHWYTTKCDDHIAEHEGVADAMDALHFKKIEISDQIFVVDWFSYIGSSTANEIEHARLNRKTIRYLTCEIDMYEEIRGMLRAFVSEEDQ